MIEFTQTALAFMWKRSLNTYGTQHAFSIGSFLTAAGQELWGPSLLWG